MKKIVRDVDGSMTLEATIVLPVFLAILLLLINLVNIALIYIAMDHAVSETVKQIAVQAYPLKYLNAASGVNSTKTKFDEYVGMTGQTQNGAGQTQNGTGQTLTAGAASELVNMIGNKIKGEVTDTAVKVLAKTVISARIKELYPLSNIEARDLKVTVVHMYNPNNITENTGSTESTGSIAEKTWGNKDIAVTVEYKIKPLVPFIPLQEIVLSNSAVERAWVDE